MRVFFVTVTKYPCQKPLREERVVLTHVLAARACHTTAVHIVVARKREGEAERGSMGPR